MVIEWPKRPRQSRDFLYEERITAWNAESFEAAIDLAETEAQEYAAAKGSLALDLFQSYWLFDSMDLIPQGTEVFSLLRESDLEPAEYLNAFFDTGAERAGNYDYAAASNSAAPSAEPAPLTPADEDGQSCSTAGMEA
jgi:hypothetical protein